MASDARALHVLVHNVSHTDIVFLVSSHASTASASAMTVPSTASPAACDSARSAHSSDATMDGVHGTAGGDASLMSQFAKPLFAAFAHATQEVSRRVLLDSHPDAALARISTHISDGVELPIGLRFPRPVELEADALTLRTPPPPGTHTHTHTVLVTGVVFPLVACLVPRWTAVTASRARSHSSRSLGTPLPHRLHMYLLSGASVPDDPDAASGTSTTDFVATLLARFLRVCYPELVVHPVSSGLDVFRFDDNANFFKQQINPRLDACITTLVAHYKEGWKRHFSATISMAAGSPARLAALNAALRRYSPSYLHLPNVKAYWYTGNLSAMLASIHFITFDEIEGTPAVQADTLEDALQSLVTEMKRHISNFCKVVRGTPDFRVVHGAAAEYTRGGMEQHRLGSVSGVPRSSSDALPNDARATARSRSNSLSRAREGVLHVRAPSPITMPGQHPRVASEDFFAVRHSPHPDSPTAATAREPDHELAKFWLRKTRQPVLAVLLVQRGSLGPRRFYHGMNLEVSMPTGSVCSERVAISMALADDPGLRRADIRAVAVVSMPKVDHPDPAVQAAYEAAGVGTAAAFYHPRSTGPAGLGLSPKILPSAVPTFMAPDGVHVSQPSAILGDAAAVSPFLQGLPGGASASTRIDTILMPPPPPMPAHAAFVRATSSKTMARINSWQDTGSMSDSELSGEPLTAGSKRARPEWGGSDTLVAASPLRRSASDDREEVAHHDASHRSASAERGWGGQAPGSATKHPRPGAPSSAQRPGDSSRVGSGTAHADGLASATGSASAHAAHAHSARSISPAPTTGRATVRRKDGFVSEAGISSPRERGFATVVHEDPAGAIVEVPVALNPIAPCGSCMEWLRKIAEVNPDFRILTFPDISCERVFVKHVN